VPAVGDLLADRYRIDGVLGAGGMATVYLATDVRLERQVAVKVLLPNLARDGSLAERFDREARILASVAHPNVAEVFDVERGDPDAGREPFYVMELCDGGSLASRIEAGGPLEPGALVPIIVSVAAALGELHRRGLIHRDVKPANILFTGGRPKLADFGLAKSGAGLGLDTLTAPGTAIGTPAYMAPELVLGGGAAAASDVYALAATTFHGLTGRAPRQADSLTTLAATAAAVPSVSELSPRLGGAFDDVVGGGLADEPAARPSLNAFTSGLVAALQAPTDAPVAATAAAASAELGVPTTAAALPAAPAFDETTRIDVPNRTTVRPPVPPRRSAPAVRRSPRRSQLPLGAAVLALAFVVIGLLALSGLSSLFQAAGEAASGQPGPTRRVPATTPSPSPAVTPSPVPSPGPTRDPAAPALAALNRVLVAIDQARGGKDGLKGGEANDLVDMAQEIGRRLRDGDYAGARQRATALEERVRKLHVDKKRSQALTAAVDDLLAAIPG
jgi:eukaryotic-like serine/threonine-protein kinase